MRIDENYLKSQIRAIQDWPKDGITFRDITSVFENPRVSRMVIDSFIHRYINQNISHIAALDARGFLLGSTLAYALHKPLILFRKKGKLPPDTLAQDYQLEYGTATLEVKTDSFSQGDRVLLIDDLIATGGTLLAAECTHQTIRSNNHRSGSHYRSSRSWRFYQTAGSRHPHLPPLVRLAGSKPTDRRYFFFRQNITQR